MVIGGRHRTTQLSVRAEVAGPRTPLLVIAGLLGLAGITDAGAVAASADGARHPVTMASIVVAVGWVDFTFVRDRLGLSDSALSKQFSTLEEAGYITIERPVTDRRRRVRVRLTPKGRKAFHGHVAALREIVATADPAGAML